MVLRQTLTLHGYLLSPLLPYMGFSLRLKPRLKSPNVIIDIYVSDVTYKFGTFPNGC